MKSFMLVELVLLPALCLAFVPSSLVRFRPTIGRLDVQTLLWQFYSRSNDIDESNSNYNVNNRSSRRDIITQGTAVASTLLLLPQSSHAAVGTLPEYADTNAILQGITIKVADKSQQDAMIQFLDESFDCGVLRKRIRGPIEETWLGFGPEQLSIPDDFTLGPSSFYQYGGHASIHLVYDSRATSPFYRIGDTAPGDNIAYLQLAVPSYRVSRMVANGGNVIDAYGIVNVVSPAGLPIRSIVGIWPDPIMFVAINCVDVAASADFYAKLGFAQQEYPYSRPNKGQGQFEPPMPSKSVYMAPSANCMGVLLLPLTTKRKKSVSVNTVVESLDLIYAPADGSSSESSSSDGVPNVVDPSGVSISFTSQDAFTADEVASR